MPSYPLRDTIAVNGREYTLYQTSAPAGQNQLTANQETAVPQLSGEPIDVSEEPLVMDTFHLGGLYSWRLLGGTYGWAENADARFPRLVLPGPFVNELVLSGATDFPRCAQDFNGDLYVGVGRYVWKISGGVAPPVADVDLGANISAWSMLTFGGNLYVGTSLGTLSTSAPNQLWQKVPGGAWSSNVSVLRKSLAQAWFQVSGTLGTVGGFQMVAQDTASSVRNVATAPLTPGNWGASIPIGDTTYGINRLIGDQTHVYIAKTNGLHDLDGITGYSPNLMPFFAAALDDENGIAGHSSGGQIFTGHLSGLFRLDVSGAASSRIVSVTPGHGLPNETPVRGKITASTSYGPWQIVAVYNGTDTYICWGRDIMQGDAGVSPFGYGYGYGPSPSAIGPSPMMWHPGIIYLPGQRCYLLYVSGLTSPPRLWLGCGNSAGQYTLKWATMPRTENPLQDPEYRYATTWTFYVPGQDWGHPATPKQLLQTDIEADNLGAGASLEIATNAEGGPYSRFGTANVSPQSQLLASQSFVGRRIGFRLNGSGTPTTPSIIRVLMPRAQVRVAVRPVRTYQILLGEGNIDRFGGRDLQRAINDFRELQALQTGDVCNLRDEFGELYHVLVQPPVDRQLLYLRGESGKGTAEPVMLVTVRVKLLPPGPDSLSTAPWYWEDGTQWDTGRIWSTGPPPAYAPAPPYVPFVWDDGTTLWDDGHTWSP